MLPYNPGGPEAETLPVASEKKDSQQKAEVTELLREKGAEDTGGGGPKKMNKVNKRFYITTPIYYVNDILI